MVRHTASSQFSSRISSNEESPSIHPPLSLRSEKNRKEDHLRGASPLLLPLPWIFEPINLDDRRERIDNGERACVSFLIFSENFSPHRDRSSRVSRTVAGFPPSFDSDFLSFLVSQDFVSLLLFFLVNCPSLVIMPLQLFYTLYTFWPIPQKNEKNKNILSK